MASHPPTDWWALLTDPAHLRDPYPALARLRAQAPVHLDPASGVFFVLGHREFGLMARSREMGRDTRLWTHGWNSPANKERDPEGWALFHEFQPQMTNANPPEHRRMRDVYEKAFTAGALEQHLPMMRSECRRLLDALPAEGPVDFITDFAETWSCRVSLRLFDMPEAMAPTLGRWVAALSLVGNVMMTPQQKRDAHAALREFKAWLRAHLRDRADAPADSFLGLALAAAAYGGMDEEESLNNLVTLIAGGAATATLLGNGLLALLRHPAQMQRLRADPGLMRGAIEEMLRYDPGSSIIIRVAIEDFDCAGTLVPAGSLAIGLVGAINRDPARFAEPDAFDIGRAPNPHFVFGGGAHICLGAALVRMAGRVGIDEWLARFSHIELAGEPVWWTHRSDQRGLHSLPLALQPAIQRPPSAAASTTSSFAP